jgi:hypothetical protein
MDRKVAVGAVTAVAYQGLVFLLLVATFVFPDFDGYLIGAYVLFSLPGAILVLPAVGIDELNIILPPIGLSVATACYFLGGYAFCWLQRETFGSSLRTCDRWLPASAIILFVINCALPFMISW